MTLSDLERRDARGQIFRRISLRVPYDIERPNSAGRHMGRSEFLRGQPRPYCKGAVLQRFPILGVPFYLCVSLLHPLSQNYQIWHGNIWGVGLFSGSATLPPQGGGGPSAPQLWDSFLFMRTLFLAEHEVWAKNTQQVKCYTKSPSNSVREEGRKV